MCEATSGLDNTMTRQSTGGESELLEEAEPVGGVTGELFIDNDADANGTAKKQRPWPEDPVEGGQSLSVFRFIYRRFYERWMFSYMNEILRKGSRQTHGNDKVLNEAHELTNEDLFAVPKAMDSRLLSSLFWEYYKKYAGRKRRVERTLWKIAIPTFLPAGICQFVAVIMQVAMPLLVRELLLVLERYPNQQVYAQGLPYAVGIFATLVVNGFANHRHRQLGMRTGVTIRAAVVSVLYEQVLRLTPRGRTGLTSGEVANLIAVDTQKLFEVTQEGHLVWSLPLSMALVTVFLVLIIGPVALVGIAVLIMFVPVVERITSKMLRIRQKRVSWTDKRIEIVSSMLQGIKVTKLNNYEANYAKRVRYAREREFHYLRQELAVWAVTLFIMVLSPVLATAATFTVYVLMNENNILSAALSFSVLLLFAALRFPINYAGRFVGKAAQAISAAKRISAFLRRETRSEQFDERSLDVISSLEKVLPNVNDKEEVIQEDSPLRLKQASFFVGADVPDYSVFEGVSGSIDSFGSFVVSKFDFTVKKGEVLAVVGPVGSGKSTLINGIIREVSVASNETEVQTRGTVAYVSQTPFILNTTIRENILFGLPFKKELYDRVLDACCLRQDLEQLGVSGDLTEIGERGVTLSGGQKQRVSLARAAYACPDLVLLDDPLSALDAGTSKQVFDRLIKKFFSETAVVLVTHAAHILNRVDNVMVITEGHNKFIGSWSELVKFHPDDEKTRTAIDHIRLSVQDEHSGEEEQSSADILDDEGASREVTKRSLMTTEEREHGISSVKTWLLWFKHAGGFYYVGIFVILMVVDRFAYVALEWWLARWTEGADESVTVFGVTFPPQTDGRSAQYQYLLVYSLILVVSLVGTLARSEWSVTGGARAAQNVFSSMLDRVLGAPLSYFESTPMGRVLNRFTYDMEVVDITLTQSMCIFLIATGWYFAGVIVMVVILPYTILAIVPVTVGYYFLMLHYRKSGPDLQRLDAVSRSPIQAMVSEGLDGCSTIRVYHKENVFLDKFLTAVNTNSSALLNFVTAQRWLGIRIELLGSAVVLVCAVLVVCLNQVLALEPGIVGLLIIWSSNFTITLGFLVDTFGEAEAAITAIERVDAMSSLPQERAMTTDPKLAVPASWPSAGELEFQDVCLRYRDGLPLALNNLSFKVKPGQSCGVVGRTGAGKSSLTVALFRLVEIESGSIFLDGIDLKSLGLADVRGRQNGMAIIPQDPFLTGSTLRECLDPFGEHSDNDIDEALAAVRLDNESVDSAMDEGGTNFSVGERQLLNLARALLSRPRVLVLDEATASIDGETDAFIQQMLRTRFKNTTLLTVAHRLGTIMDYDVILVMESGRCAEFGSPAELLARNGVFAELVNSTGSDSSKALRAIADSRSNVTLS